MDPEDKVVFVSGANRGIDFGTTLEMAKQGYKVAAGYRDRYRAEKLSAEAKKADNIFPVKVDVTVASDLEQLYELIESCGVIVVGEDNCWGNRYSDALISTTTDPLEAIISRYQAKSPCPYVFFPPELRAEYCRDKAIESKARGVAFYISEWDPSQIWDYPEQKRLLDVKGIPNICFMHQKYLISDKKYQSLHREYST